MKEIKTFESTDCRRTRPLLDDFLADELSVETNRLILAHLDICASCRDDRDRRLELRNELRTAWAAQPAPESLEAAVRRATDRNWLPVRIAAGLMVPLIAVLLYSQFFTGPAATVVDHLLQIAQDHIDCRGVPRLDETTPLDVRAAGIEAVLSSRGDFKLVAVQDCENDGAHFTHYVFEGQEGRISLALEGAQRSRTSCREVQQQLRRMRAGLEVRALELPDVHSRSVSIAALELDNHFVYLIGDNFDRAETLSLTEDLVPALQGAL